jgi:hypothetical protein
MIYFFGLLGAVAGVGLEWRYATAPYFWSLRVLPWMVVGNLVISYSIFRIIKYGDNLILALMVYSLCTLSLRTFLTVAIQGNQVTRGTWVALVFLFAAQISKFWR